MPDEPIKSQPYEGLAAIYDHVMRHVDYAHWANHVISLLQRHDSAPAHLVELACGTGTIACRLARQGYRVDGLDASAEMIAVARGKVEDATQVRFDVRDVRDLQGVGPFDGALCLYDSLNYLLSVDDVDDALGQVYDVLRPGALFIFDVCTERNSVSHFADVRDTEQGPGYHYTRHSYYDEDERLQFNAFDIHYEDGTRRREKHVQRIHPHDVWVDRCQSSPFDLVEALDGFTLRPGSERSDRVHFILRRPS